MVAYTKPPKKEERIKRKAKGEGRSELDANRALCKTTSDTPLH